MSRRAADGTAMSVVPATAFAAVLAEAAVLLRGLLGRRTAVPGSSPEGVPAPDGRPVHRAAGHLVTVDRVRLPVADALMLVRGRPYGDPAEGCPLEEIVEQCLLMNETLEDGEPLDDADLLAAAEDFRAGHGLRDRASTLARLAELPLSGEQFEAFIAGIARRRRFRRRKEAELAPAHLAANRSDFDRVRALWVTGSRPVNGESLRGPDGLVWNGEAVVTVGERWVRDLPPPLRHAVPGALVGPMTYGEGYLTGIVLERRAVRDGDAETLAAAGEAAFGEWLAARRRRASVEWHWL